MRRAPQQKVPPSTTAHYIIKHTKDGESIRVPDSELDGREAKVVAALRFLGDEASLPSKVAQRQQILEEIGHAAEALQARDFEQTPARSTVWETQKALDLYFNHAKGRLAPKSLKTYRDIANIFSRAFPDGIPTPEVFDSWLGQLQIAKNSRRDYFNHIRVIFGWLHEKYGVPDPTTGLKPPQKSRDIPDTLTFNEIEQVVSMPLTDNWGRYADRDYALLRLLQRSGIRIGGALALEQSNLYKGYIIVTQKGKRSAAACEPETIDLLRKLGTPHIFMAEGAKPLRYSGARRIIKKALRMTGVDRKGICAHVMRRGFATAMNRRAMPTSSLSDMLAHASIRQTEEYIQHDLDSMVSAYSRFAPWNGSGHQNSV